MHKVIELKILQYAIWKKYKRDKKFDSWNMLLQQISRVFAGKNDSW